MSLNFKNKIISESSPDIMEYLIKKLETRQRNLYNYANMFNSINSIEEFYIKRKDIFNLFQNLEEELRQASLAIKALMVQNKVLSEENIKSLNIKKNNKKLLNENNYLLKENNNLTQKLKKNNEKQILDERNKSPSFNKDYQNYKFRNNVIQNKKYKTNYKLNECKSNNNKESNNNRNNKFKNKKKLDKNKNIHLNESYDDIKGLKDVKSIMENMKANKIKLKEVINEHFGKEAFQ